MAGESSGASFPFFEAANEALQELAEADGISAARQRAVRTALLELRTAENVFSGAMNEMHSAASYERLERTRWDHCRSSLDELLHVLIAEVAQEGLSKEEAAERVTSRLREVSPHDEPAIQVLRAYETAEHARRQVKVAEERVLQSRASYSKFHAALAAKRDIARRALSRMMLAEKVAGEKLASAIESLGALHAANVAPELTKNAETALRQLLRRQAELKAIQAEFQSIVSQIAAGEGRVTSDVTRLLDRLKDQRRRRVESLWPTKRSPSISPTSLRRWQEGPPSSSRLLPPSALSHPQSGFLLDLTRLLGDERELAEDLRSSVVQIIAQEHPVEFLRAVSQAIEGLNVERLNPNMIHALASVMAQVLNQGKAVTLTHLDQPTTIQDQAEEAS